MTSAPLQKLIRRGSAAEMARASIEQAERDGVDRAQMVLRMTLRDSAELKRDPKVATADVSFGQGGMRYLGVLVEQGGVTLSILDRGDGAPAVEKPAEPEPKPKAKRKKAATAI